MTEVQLIGFFSCYSSSGLFKHPCPWSMSPLFPLQLIVGWEWPHWHLYAPGWLVEVKLHQDRWVLIWWHPCWHLRVHSFLTLFFFKRFNWVMNSAKRGMNLWHQPTRPRKHCRALRSLGGGYSAMGMGLLWISNPLSKTMGSIIFSCHLKKLNFFMLSVRLASVSLDMAFRCSMLFGRLSKLCLYKQNKTNCTWEKTFFKTAAQYKV